LKINKNELIQVGWFLIQSYRMKNPIRCYITQYHGIDEKNKSSNFWISYNFFLDNNREVDICFLITNKKKTIPFYIVVHIRSKHLEFPLPLMYRKDLKVLGWKDQYTSPLFRVNQKHTRGRKKQRKLRSNDGNSNATNGYP